MITRTNVRTIEMNRGAGPKADNQIPRTARFEVGDTSHEMAFDGKLEDAVLKGSMDGRQLVADLPSALRLISTESAKGACAQLDSGAESIKVELEGQQWKAIKKPADGVYEFALAGLDFSSNRIQTNGEHVALHFEGDIGGKTRSHAKQRLVGAVNSNGTLTVLHEDLTITESARSLNSLWS